MVTRSRRPGPTEMVVLKKPHPLDVHFKVTARYTVQLGDGESLQCIRVTGYPGATRHFSLDEFNRLFKYGKERA